LTPNDPLSEQGLKVLLILEKLFNILSWAKCVIVLIIPYEIIIPQISLYQYPKMERSRG